MKQVLTALAAALTVTSLSACTGGVPTKPKFAVGDCVMPPDGRADSILKIAAVGDTEYQVRMYSIVESKTVINGEEQSRMRPELDKGMYSSVNCP